MQTEKFFQTMSDKTEIAVNRWIPDEKENIKAVIVLSHGMLEHSLRYDRLGCILSEKGFVLNAHDHRGHGRTAFNAEQKGTGMFGKLADKDGFSKAVSDLSEVISKTKADYAGKKIILLGHSFGSFVAQSYMETHGGDIDGCILCGTSGPQSGLGLKSFILALAVIIHGTSYKSKFIQGQAFKGYNKRIQNPEHGFEWISKSTSNLEMYKNDSWCGGVASVSFFRDMVQGLKKIHNIKNIDCIPKTLPIYLMSGTEDPVGNYGKSVEALAAMYKKQGIQSVQVKLYDGDRHEILNEDDSDTVIADTINWIESIVK